MKLVIELNERDSHALSELARKHDLFLEESVVGLIRFHLEAMAGNVEREIGEMLG